MKKQNDIESFISGNRETFESLYNSYVGKIFNYINSFIYDSDLAKDITQNTFLQLWDSRSNLDVNGNIEAIYILLPEIYYSVKYAVSISLKVMPSRYRKPPKKRKNRT